MELEFNLPKLGAGDVGAIGDIGIAFSAVKQMHREVISNMMTNFK